MRKLLIICMLITVISCDKNTVIPTVPVHILVTDTITSDTTMLDTIVTDTLIDTIIDPVTELLFFSILDDSVSYESDSISQDLYLYYDESDYFKIRIVNIIPDSVKVGVYTNEYLISNANYGFILSHDVYVGDGTIVGINIGSSATQINRLEITKIENDKVWLEFDVDWHYTHWLYTYKNKSGTIIGKLNGLTFR